VRHIATKNQRNPTSERYPKGELAKVDPSPWLLGSLEAKASIFIINVNNIIIVRNTSEENPTYHVPN
jgi:hypothetical protein